MVTYDSRIPALGIYSTENKTFGDTNSYRWIHIAALFIIVKTRTWSKCPLTCMNRQAQCDIQSEMLKHGWTSKIF